MGASAKPAELFELARQRVSKTQSGQVSQGAGYFEMMLYVDAVGAVYGVDTSATDCTCQGFYAAGLGDGNSAIDGFHGFGTIPVLLCFE